MSTDSLIEARGLHTHYGASHILRGVDFTVGKGQTIGLMGRNGMGKTTLLKSLMGIVKPSGGKVHVKGQDMTGAPTFEIARLGLA
jgi:branched-chain amino acid transport system ATP-binding protein